MNPRAQKIIRMKKGFSRGLWWLGERAFILTLCFFGVAFGLAVFVFCAYFLSPKHEILIKESSEYQFRAELFSQAVRIKQEREQRFQDAAAGSSRDIFRQ